MDGWREMDMQEVDVQIGSQMNRQFDWYIDRWNQIIDEQRMDRYMDEHVDAQINKQKDKRLAGYIHR